MGIPSNLEWKFWGRRDPLWAVAAWRGRNRGGKNPWTDEEFYALGLSDWEDFRVHWERYGVRRGVALEIGCGAGRLSRPMADYFDKLKAMDVSEDMLKYARANVTSPNVEFICTDGASLPVGLRSVDAVFSTHVFQHLESPRDGFRYFQEIARVLSPGGTMMVHMPVFSWPYGASEWLKKVFYLGKKLEDHRVLRLRRQILQGGSPLLMRMHSYELRQLYQELPEMGFEDIELSVFVTKANNAPHPFVLARRGVD